MTTPGPGNTLQPGVAGRVAASVAAIVVGYLALILLSTLVQESLLGGVSYRKSSLATLLAAGLMTPLCGVLAGSITGMLARRRAIVHAVPMAVAIAVETTALCVSGRVDGPLWFESLAGGTLIVGVIAGAVLAGRWQGRAGKARERASSGPSAP